MSAVRGYDFGDAEPRHEVKKRTYRPCVECGKPTWSIEGICSACSGITEKRNKHIMSGRAETKDWQGERVWELLRDTDLMQFEIAERCGVEPAYVSAIRCGRMLTGLTGGYVLRPYEREK